MTPKIALSIVIQTKNEEKYLPKLLQSILEQDFREKYEVIVADGGSTDSTLQIAKRFDCKVVDGKSHARGINAGAQAAQADTVLFLDADTILTRRFLTANYSEFVRRKLDVAICPFSSTSKKIIDILMNEATKHLQLFSFWLRPYISGFCFMARRKKFLELGGFDESVKWFDDLAFSNKLSKNERLGVLSEKIMVSHRRAEKAGRLKLGLVNFTLAFYRLIGRNYNGTY